MSHRTAYWAAGLVLAGLLTGALAACGAEESPAPERARYLTTIAPFRAVLAPVVGARGDVSVLLEAGGSPHTYEPRPSDLRAAMQSTALFYGAHHLDEWAAELPAPHRVALMGLVPDTERLSWAEGAGHAAHAGHTADPHFWTDPMAVRAMLPALADTLCQLDAEGCSTYRANADSFATRLVALDAELEALMEPVRELPVMLAQPFFRYFLHRYGPHLAGVIEPQPGQEPSPRAIQSLIQTVRERRVQAVFAREHMPLRATRAVAEATGTTVHTLDPIGGAAGRQTYTEILRYNARIIAKALEPIDTGS